MPHETDFLPPQLSEWPERIQQCRDLLIANAIMFGEMPAPTGREAARVRFMQDRLIESGCQSVSTDELGNAVGILPGCAETQAHILLSGHLDTPFSESVDHTIRVEPDRLIGPGILDNSLGLAVIATLPTILNVLDIKLQHPLMLLGSSRSLGFGDIEGIRFFLKNNPLPIKAGIIVEGGSLGRLSHASLGMMRGVISVGLPEDYDFLRYGASGTIPVLNAAISRLLAIRLPKVPATEILLGSMDGGTSFNTVAKTAQLRFEIRSEQTGLIAEIEESIAEFCEELAGTSGMQVEFSPVARRFNGGIAFSHPLIRATRKVFKALAIKASPVPSTGELAALAERQIPGLTLGITEGFKRHQFNERVHIEPIFRGIAQLIAVLTAIDGGVCDVED